MPAPAPRSTRMMNTATARRAPTPVSLRQLAWLLFAAGVLAGCSRPTRVEGAWAGDAARDQSFGAVLVVGVSPAYTTRCRFERMMMDSLVSAGTRAMTSCSQMRSDEPLTREAVVRAVQALGADAVLSTRLVDGKVGVKEGGSSETRSEAYYKPIGYGYDPYYGAFGLPVTYVSFTNEQAAFTVQRTAVVSSNLYAVRDASLVYVVDATAYDKGSQGEVIDAITAGIAGQLQRAGVLRGQR